MNVSSAALVYAFFTQLGCKGFKQYSTRRTVSIAPTKSFLSEGFVAQREIMPTSIYAPSSVDDLRLLLVKLS